MIELTEIDTDILEGLTIYLAEDYRENKTATTSYSNPFHWMKCKFTILGVKSQVEELKKKHFITANVYKNELINLLRRTCQYKNGKSQERRIKEALEIFTYLDIEAEFEEGLE